MLVQFNPSGGEHLNSSHCPHTRPTPRPPAANFVGGAGRTYRNQAIGATLGRSTNVAIWVQDPIVWVYPGLLDAKTLAEPRGNDQTPKRAVIAPPPASSKPLRIPDLRPHCADFLKHVFAHSSPQQGCSRRTRRLGAPYHQFSADMHPLFTAQGSAQTTTHSHHRSRTAHPRRKMMATQFNEAERRADCTQGMLADAAMVNEPCL